MKLTGLNFSFLKSIVGDKELHYGDFYFFASKQTFFYMKRFNRKKLTGFSQRKNNP